VVSCPVCVGESAKGNEVRTCRECLAESMFKREMIDLKTAHRFCECFKFNHNREKLDKAHRLVIKKSGEWSGKQDRA